jgi:hypothetical protein
VGTANYPWSDAGGGNTQPTPALPSTTLSSPTVPSVTISAPAAGTYVNGPVNIAATINGGQNISKVSVLWNGTVVQQNSGSFGVDYNFNFSFAPQSLNSQNLLEIDASDATGATGKSTVILYNN